MNKPENTQSPAQTEEISPVEELKADELDEISGGDLYMQNPRGRS